MVDDQSKRYHDRRVFSISLVMPPNVTLQEMADYIKLEMTARVKQLHPSNPMFYFDVNTVKVNPRFTQRKPKLTADMQQRAKRLPKPRNATGKNQWSK